MHISEKETSIIRQALNSFDGTIESLLQYNGLPVCFISESRPNVIITANIIGIEIAIESDGLRISLEVNKRSCIAGSIRYFIYKEDKNWLLLTDLTYFMGKLYIE